MLTQGYAGPATDTNFNSRQAINPYETHFTQSTLPGSTTAAIFFEVDDQSGQVATNLTTITPTSNPIMAQPLYVAGITVASPANTANCNSGTSCNMVVAVTLNDTVFAWNADATSTSSALLWSRQGAPGVTGNLPGNAGNALWYGDCGLSGGPALRGDTLQFEGILSTPVIDASGSSPVMFLTSYCQDSSGNPQWWLHEIKLTTGADAVTPRHIGGTSGDFPALYEPWQQQRPALLEVKNSGNSSTPNLIYILFGTGTKENVYPLDYTGWVVAYESTSGALSPKFAYSNEQTSCGTGGGLTAGGSSNGQCTGNSGSPSCDCYVSSGPQNAPNWGGHGGGCWQSGNGPAATAANAVGSDGAVHVFLGCGNGGFQQFTGSAPNNYGTTEMDFRLTGSTYDQAPFQTFTPNTPASGVGPVLPSTCGCGSGCVACTLTLQALNAYDYDFASGGQALFNDLAGSLRLATTDKAGYGYLLTPGNLCGSGSDTACVGYGSGDPGSLMTFGAAKTLCSAASLPVTGSNPDSPNKCDRVTSMAVYDNQGSGSGRRVHLIYWPYSERLTEVQVSDHSTAASGATGQTLTWSGGSSMTLGLPACTGAGCACTANQNCLGDQIVPGDTLSLSGCSCVGGTCPTVTTVTDATNGSSSSLTINMSITSAYGSGCTSRARFRIHWLDNHTLARFHAHRRQRRLPWRCCRTQRELHVHAVQQHKRANLGGASGRRLTARLHRPRLGHVARLPGAAQQRRPTGLEVEQHRHLVRLVVRPAGHCQRKCLRSHLRSQPRQPHL